MAEPTSSVATAVATSVVVPTLIAFGVPLGLRVDLLVAGFAGGLVGLVLLSTVPSTGDTWRTLFRDTARRGLVMVASSLTAGYITPLAMLVANVPTELLLGSAFVVGGGAQRIFEALVRKFSNVAPNASPAMDAQQGGTP